MLIHGLYASGVNTLFLTEPTVDIIIQLITAIFISTRKREKKKEWRDFFGQLWPPARYPNQTSKSSLFRMTALFLLVGAQHISEHSSPPPAEPVLTQFSVQLITHTKVSRPRMKHRCWTQRVPTRDQPRFLVGVRSSFALLSTHITWSISVTTLPMRFI